MRSHRIVHHSQDRRSPGGHLRRCLRHRCMIALFSFRQSRCSPNHHNSVPDSRSPGNRSCCLCRCLSHRHMRSRSRDSVGRYNQDHMGVHRRLFSRSPGVAHSVLAASFLFAWARKGRVFLPSNDRGRLHREEKRVFLPSNDRRGLHREEHLEMREYRPSREKEAANYKREKIPKAIEGLFV